MRFIAFTSLLLPLLILSGCSDTDLYAPYDCEEEKRAFFKSRTEVIIKEQSQIKEKLLKELEELPEEAAEATRMELEKKLANAERRLLSPEFFSFASIDDLPDDLDWNTNWDSPDIGSPEAKKGGTFNTFFGSLSFPPTIRTIGSEANNGFRGEHWDFIEMGLVNLHPNTLEIIPGIADRWAVDPNGRTVYYRIDEKATWSDGTPVTADDFFMTFYIALSEYITGPWYRQFYGEMFENITRYDDKHISIRLANLKPMPAYWAAITPYAAHFYSEFGPDFEDRYNWRCRPTTGAYIIKPKDIVKGRSITMSRVKNWWARDRKYTRNLFNPDRIRYLLVRDNEKVFELFKKGQIDMFHLGEPKHWYEQMEIPAVFNGYIHKVVFYNEYPRVPRGIYLNHAKPPMDNLDVRVGIQHATDWQSVIDYDLRGDAQRLHITNDGYSLFPITAVRTREFDPEKARQAFAKGGFDQIGDDGILRNAEGVRLSIAITYTKIPVVDNIMQRLAERAKLAGLEYRLDGMDGTANFQKVMNKKHEAAFWGWGITPPFPRYYEGWHSSTAYEPGTKIPMAMTNNISIYNNSEIDPHAEAVRFGTSIKKIHEASIKAEEILHRDAAWVPAYKKDSYRLGHWRWMCWPDDFNIKLTNEAQESYIYWIDEDKKQETLKAKAAGESYPEVDAIHDKYRKQ
ncbi:MAG: extracellular solute-binding protein [Luteolibacter sp.]